MILDEFKTVWNLGRCRELQHLFFHEILVLGLEQAVVVLGRNIALEGADAPSLCCGFPGVPFARNGIFDLKKGAKVSPRKDRNRNFTQ